MEEAGFPDLPDEGDEANVVTGVMRSLLYELADRHCLGLSISGNCTTFRCAVLFSVRHQISTHHDASFNRHFRGSPRSLRISSV